MKYSYAQFQEAIPNLEWSQEQLAEKLSIIGHETEVDGNNLVVTLTSNRKDCQDFIYLVFDLCGVYQNLTTNLKPSLPDHGELIPVTTNQINKLLGSSIKLSDLQKLEKLGFIVDDQGVKVPTFRTGIDTVADIAEEILRVIGFNSVDVRELSTKKVVDSNGYRQILAIKQALVNIGLFETQTYSFAPSGSVELKNPFSARDPYLRSSLTSGLLEAAAKNPFMKRVACFEIGNVFNPNEQTTLGILLTGQKSYDQNLAAINNILNTNITLTLVNNADCEQLGVKQPNPMLVEIPLVDVPTLSVDRSIVEIPRFKPISKYPPLVRDVTIEINEEALLSMLNKLQEDLPELLLVEVVDRYTKPGSNQSSITIRCIFQKHESSFTESEINHIAEQLLGFLN